MLLVCASCCASHSGNHQARFGVGTVVYTALPGSRKLEQAFALFPGPSVPVRTPVLLLSSQMMRAVYTGSDPGRDSGQDSGTRKKTGEDGCQNIFWHRLSLYAASSHSGMLKEKNSLTHQLRSSLGHLASYMFVYLKHTADSTVVLVKDVDAHLVRSSQANNSPYALFSFWQAIASPGFLEYYLVVPIYSPFVQLPSYAVIRPPAQPTTPSTRLNTSEPWGQLGVPFQAKRRAVAVLNRVTTPPASLAAASQLAHGGHVHTKPLCGAGRPILLSHRQRVPPQRQQQRAKHLEEECIKCKNHINVGKRELLDRF
ncbi:hypothetical protein C8R44DRAFT_858720 [Mycena epipterygia]|nr:hypothetical protein C8R44DRAFT_858720 [Mycena epipterygia]